MPTSTAWLANTEADRLATLRHSERRAQYLSGHWLVRELLVAALGGDANDWSLEERRSHAPSILDPPRPMWLSISHSGEWIAAAVANVEVGIDIEQKPRQLDASFEPLLRNPNEPAGVLSNDELLRRWVAKEACLKSRGGGALPERLNQISLHDVPTKQAPLRTVSDSRFCLALAIGADARVIWNGQSLPWDISGFTVRERTG